MPSLQKSDATNAWRVSPANEYCSTKIADHLEEKSSFVYRCGTYQCKDVKLGLMNAPDTFQRLINTVQRGIEFAMVYVDDVVIQSKKLKEHFLHFFDVFCAIAYYVLKINVTKCSFGQSKVRSLIHIKVDL